MSSNTLPLLAQKYLIGPMIGSGSFGQVYLATVEGSDTLYAVKKEDERVKHPQLYAQSKILRNFHEVVGFPKVHWVGSENKATFMVMQLLGPNIEDLFFMCEKKFSLKTVLMLFEQMIHKIEHLHAINYIHRDIKPENFLIGLEAKSHILHLVDFGLSKRYRDVKTHQHIAFKQNKSLTGTVRYASINTHFGFQQSRRDDLESVGYVAIYLAQGSLPWQGVKANNRTEKYEKIQEKKLSLPIQVICRGLPIEFATYMNYCRTLKFEDKPDYKYLRKMFRDLFDRIGYSWDYCYDWCNFEIQKCIQTQSLSIKIEKRGEDIPESELQKTSSRNIPLPKVEFEDCIEEKEIDVNVITDYNGSQNVEESQEESDISMIDRHQKQRIRNVQAKKMGEW